MGRETYAVLTGLFLIVLGAVSVVITIWLGHYNVERNTYIVTSSQPVSGLNPESTVYYRGVEIGKVSAINFDPSNVRVILIRIRVGLDAPITRGTYASLRVQPLTGLAQIDLNDSGENREPLPTRNDDPARIPLRPSLVDRISESGQTVLRQAEELTARLNSLLNDQNQEQVRRILADFEMSARQLNKTFAELPALSGDLHKMLNQVDLLVLDMKKTSASMRTLAQTSQGLAVSGKLAGETLATATVPQLNALLSDLEVTAGHIRRLAATLENDPQALLLGPRRSIPGPGEPGYREPK